jgi:YbgC/YbaW family acyl-CoA thioester hydrolase
MSDDSFPFRHQLVVRFSDCDPMGHANHAAYFTYFEQCRLTWWRHLGSTTGLPGAATVIVHAECDYRSSALAHDQLEVRLNLGGIGRSSVTLTYEIVNATTGVRLAEGRTVNVTLDAATRQLIPVPEATRALLERGKAIDQ